MRPLNGTIAVLVLAISLPVSAREPAPGISVSVEKKMNRILGQTCGAEDQGALEGAKQQIDSETAKRYLTWVLTNGAPEGERHAAREAAARRFEMKKAVLAKPNQKLFDADMAARLRAAERDSYLDAAVTGIDRIYRGNAIRWVGEIAGQDAIPMIRAAAASDTALGRLADAAIATIQSRNRAK